MRITISINDDQYPEVINHIKFLRSDGKNISRFFSEAAKDYIIDKNKKEKERLKELIKEVIEEEGLKSINSNKSKSKKTEDQELRKKLNNMFKEIEGDENE